MEPAVPTPPSPTSGSLVAAPEQEPVELRVRRLAAARRRATALLAARTRSARLVPRLAAWLSGQANADRFAGHAADLVVTVAEALRDEDVQQVLTAELTRAAGAVEVAPLAGRALRVVIAGGHHAD